MDTIEHGGYRGSVRFSADDRVFYGKLLGINDVITFEAETVDELEVAFHEAVEDYLVTCKELGKAPERAYSGKIPLRIDPELHRAIALEADSAGSSLNAWISASLKKTTA